MSLDLDNITVVFDYSDGEVADIKRCLETLYQTSEGTCPLDRDFGINISFVGMPADDKTKNLFAVELIDKTERYEPRAKIKDINYAMNAEGQVKAEVVITSV